MGPKTFIEKLLVVLAYLGLIGGIGTGLLMANGIWESQTEMCFPQAVFTAVSAIITSVAFWAILITIVNISYRTRKIEELLSK